MVWKILDIPQGLGASRPGCHLGSQGLRAAGLVQRLRQLGHHPLDIGAVRPGTPLAPVHPNPAIRALSEISAWTVAAARAAFEAGDGETMFLGGDHSISAGTIAGVAHRATLRRRPLFVLWVDAHPDFHTLDSTRSGNLHGVPLAYVSGRPGFVPWFPPLAAAVDSRRICTLGTRDFDPGEREALCDVGAQVHDMAAVERHGIVPLVGAFLDRVAAQNGLLHVSFDVDVLDPSVAPGVGTAVPRGLGLNEAHLLMETLHDSGLVTSLDVVELNPLLDAGGRTAGIVVDLLAALMGEGAAARERKIA